MDWRILATIVAFVGFLAAILGIIVDAPQAMTRVIEESPTWLANPDIWWVGIIGLITAIALFFVWRKSKPRMGATTNEEHLLFRIEVAAGRLEAAKKKSRSLPDAERHEFLSRAVDTDFDATLGAAMYSLYGRRERDKYLKVLRAAKNDSGPLAASKAATAYLGSYVFSRATERKNEIISDLQHVSSELKTLQAYLGSKQ